MATFNTELDSSECISCDNSKTSFIRLTTTTSPKAKNALCSPSTSPNILQSSTIVKEGNKLILKNVPANLAQNFLCVLVGQHGLQGPLRTLAGAKITQGKVHCSIIVPQGILPKIAQYWVFEQGTHMAIVLEEKLIDNLQQEQPAEEQPAKKLKVSLVVDFEGAHQECNLLLHNMSKLKQFDFSSLGGSPSTTGDAAQMETFVNEEPQMPST